MKLALALFIAPIVSVNAATEIIVWGGKYVSSYTPLNAGTSSSEKGTTTWAWSDTTPINPAGPKFYGAFRLSNSSNEGAPAFHENYFGMLKGAGDLNDNIRLSAAAESGTLSMRGLIYFKKDDFFASGGPVRFNADSSLSVTITSSIGGKGGRNNRFAVYALVGSQWGWYLSSDNMAGQTTFDKNPMDMTWAAYDPNGSELLPAAPTSYKVDAASFEEIGAVGLFINYTQVEGGNATIHFTSFKVSAATNP